MRLLAALLAPVMAVIALLIWVPTTGVADLHAVSDIALAQPRGSVAELPARPTHAHDSSRTSTRTGTHTSTRTATRTGTAPVTAAPATTEVPLPLVVTMRSLTPGVVPKRGPVVVRGRVVNRSDDTWTDINVYACSSHQPITTADGIEAAVEADASAVVCGRTSVFATIKTLAPHSAKRYSLRVARDKLGIGTAPGVYWFGVQALGSSPAGRDATADGSVRTFLPLVEKSPARAEVSLVIPLRRSTAHTSDGRLVAPEDWARDLGPGGRLSNLLNLAEQAPSGSVSLLTDPAVVAAARQLAGGNLPRSLGPTKEAPVPDADAVTRSAAAAWVERFRAVAPKQRVLSLPYGDLDVASAAETDSSVVSRAFDQSEALFRELKVGADLVVAPPSGVVPSDALPALRRATVLLSDVALPTELSSSDEPLDTVSSNGHLVRIYSSSVATGGPGPTSGLRALALRQRILAEAAVRAGLEDEQPMIVALPDHADPGDTAEGFFDELDRTFVDLGTSLAGTTPAPEIGDLAAPVGSSSKTTNDTLFRYVDQLVELGHSLDVMLPGVNDVASTATREALSAASYQALESGSTTSARLAALLSTVAWFSTRLDEVTIDAPSFVVLSSRTGLFAMTVTNGLEQPIRIRVRARTDKSLVIRAPRTIEVPAESSRTVNLSAEANSIGVHPVVLVATDADGRAIQQSHEISIRTNNSGRVIWVIMAGGAALLFGAIVLRLVRRRRNRS